MKVSYDAEELIAEAKADYKLFGNEIVYAMIEDWKGALLLTNYDFILEEDPLTEQEKKKYKFIVKAPLKNVIRVLELEDSLFTEYESLIIAYITELGIPKEEFTNEFIEKVNHLN